MGALSRGPIYSTWLPRRLALSGLRLLITAGYDVVLLLDRLGITVRLGLARRSLGAAPGHCCRLWHLWSLRALAMTTPMVTSFPLKNRVSFLAPPNVVWRGCLSEDPSALTTATG